MKRFVLAIAALAFATPAVSQVWVNGYTRSDGTYVAGHMRSSPDSTTVNNYSYQPPVSPYAIKPIAPIAPIPPIAPIAPYRYTNPYDND